jgi:Ca2+-binding RTX toxin-like protein
MKRLALLAVLFALPAAPAAADHVSVTPQVSARLGDRLSDSSWAVVVDWSIECAGPAPGAASYTGSLYLDDVDTTEALFGGGTAGASGTDTFAVERRAAPRRMRPRIKASCFDSQPANHGSDTIEVTGNIVLVPARGDENGDGVIDPPPGGVGGTTGPPPSGPCAVEQRGTSAADTLIGTPGGDRIIGLEGDDFLRGLEGDDCLEGGPGVDRLSGGPGNDVHDGGADRDRLDGDGGNDRLIGGPGTDGMTGRSGDDSLSGGSGGDRVVGAAGNDRLAGDGGDDSISGGAGRDRLFGGRGADRLLGGPGPNRYSGGPGNDVIDARNGVRERVSCGSGRDRARVDRRDRVRGCERASRG